jgi:hypothetical protein
MTDHELLQMALNALEHYKSPDSTIKALRARLAQPEPEPFEYWNAVEGWVKIDEVRQHFDTAGCGTIYKTGGEGRVPLYTTPQREWVGLTDETYWEMWVESPSDVLRFAHAIETKLREKNT